MEIDGFNFELNRMNTKGALTPENVEFFYYTLGFPLEKGIKGITLCNKELEAWISNNNIIISSVKSIPNLVFEVNQIQITLDNIDGNDKFKSTLRHLRNAYAHYNIIEEGEYFLVSDRRMCGKKEEITMCGKIEQTLLRELIKVLNNKFEEEIEKMYNQTTSSENENH